MTTLEEVRLRAQLSEFADTRCPTCHHYFNQHVRSCAYYEGHAIEVVVPHTEADPAPNLPDALCIANYREHCKGIP